MDLLHAVRSAAEEVAGETGVTLLDIQTRGRPGSQAARLIVDTVGGISAEDLANVSRQFDLVWESRTGEQRGFTLEVNSPGPNRALATEQDFSLIPGKTVTVKCRGPEDEKAQEITGEVVSCAGGILQLMADEQLSIPLEDMESAKLVYRVGGQGKKGNRQRKAKKSRNSGKSPKRGNR